MVNPIPEENDTTQSSISLGGTSWVGVYNDTFQGYDAKLIWSLDFTSETEGEFFLELTVAGQSQGNHTVPFTYTFDGTNGVMKHETIRGATQNSAAPLLYTIGQPEKARKDIKACPIAE